MEYDQDEGDTFTFQVEQTLQEQELSHPGFLDVTESTEVMSKLDIKTSRKDMDRLFIHFHTQLKDGKPYISLRDFETFIITREAHLKELYQNLSIMTPGYLDPREVRAGLRKSGFHGRPTQVLGLLERLSATNAGHINYQQFRRSVGASVHIRDAFGELHDLDLGEPSFTVPSEVSINYDSPINIVLAGGLAGAVSRTSTAPLDRLKVLLQVGGAPGRKDGVSGILREIHREGGLRAFWRGNGTNVVKIMPETACKFFVYESAKKALAADPDHPKIRERFAAGSFAGVVAQSLVYPLEVTKTRLAISPRNTYRGVMDCMAKTFTREGPMGLFKGITPSLLGIIPYAGVDLALYSTLKEAWMSRHPEAGQPSTLTLLGCGAFSSSCGQICAYPFQLVRTRLQAQGSPGRPVYYKGMFDCFTKVIQHSGPAGLYKGILPNFMKAVPAISISYAVYEKTKVFLAESRDS